MRRCLVTMLLLGYFLYCCGDSLYVWFAPDDMMNMGVYWRMPPLRLLAAQFLPWRGFYRPFGGVFYMPIFHAFGLNPAPYHVVILVLLFANAGLLYRLARALGCERLAAGLTALLACYHAGLTNLTYSIAFVYDVLCCFFYLAAFLVYIRYRTQTKAVPLFLLLYLCALNSKEMAVTLPGMLLVYEWLYHRAPRPRVLLWPLGGAILLTALSVYGKLAAPGALAADSAYRPVLSIARVAAFQIRSLSDLFERPEPITITGLLLIWFLFTWLAWRRPRPVLRFCWFFLMLTPLPIEFLEGRGGACLYIPFAGWAIFLSVLLLDFARPLAAFLANEPLLCRVGRSALFACLVFSAGALWAHENQRIKDLVQRPAMRNLGQTNRRVLAQMDALHPRLRPGSTVVFLNDPFVDWDMAFIADLWFHDRSLNIKLQRKTPLSEAELAQAGHLFDFQDGRLVQLR